MTLWTELEGLDYTIRRVQVGDWSTRLLEHGEGEPLILMHGTGGHLEAFIRNLRALGARHRVILFDYAGHGWTTPTTRDQRDAPVAVRLLRKLPCNVAIESVARPRTRTTG